jgi:uncharacterized protein
MYNDGVKVDRSYAEAMKWLRLAAEQDDVSAQTQVGWIYMYGVGASEGIPQEYVQALMWLELAAARRSERAEDHRDKLLKKMTPAQIEEARHLAHDWKPKSEAP